MMSWFALLISACVVAQLQRCHVLGANILISAMYGEGSHFMAGAGIGESLVQRGHDVTFLISNAYQHRARDPRYSNFSFLVFNHPVPVEDVFAAFDAMTRLSFQRADTQFYHAARVLTERNADDCLAVLSDKNLMKRLGQIDAIVMDPTWLCGIFIKAALENTSGFGKNITMISLTPTPPVGSLLELAGAPFSCSHQPQFSTGYSNRMTFAQRTANVFHYFAIRLLYSHLLVPVYNKVRDKLDLDSDFTVFSAIEKFDLFLVNVDVSSDFPFPLTPNIITVGGLTTRPRAPLDKELEEFMESSGEDGVVVFGLGTQFASITTTRPDIAEMFAEVFQRIPQKVVWQLKDLPPNFRLPRNVKALPWLPQNDLLGHPKTRVFMYHGGNNGFQEASYHGVPLVVIPLLGDQYDVAARVEARGMGRKIDKLALSVDVIYDTLTEVINNPTYRTIAKQVSAINRHRPLKAPDRAAFWIEHVINFGGDHLRSTANELSFIQYYLLDVFALVIFVLIIFCLLTYSCLRCCYSLCRRRLFTANRRTKQD